ncbi:MAG TPA: hypothetical protein VKW08_18755 [Xanthobacteraceae bacterium]|nr:hypothetical protein [Xanthobacteraceae bacterium]
MLKKTASPMSNIVDHYDGSVVDHERTFRFFTHLVYVAVMHVANFLVALAIGGVQGHWGTALFIMVLATGLAATSFVRGNKLPLAILLIFSLAILGLAA